MPKYELMYLLGSHISDDQIPGITESVKKFLGEFGAENVEENQIGKKKLAYPIKKTRNGYYVVVTFDMTGSNINAFEAKVRSQSNNIIRHLIVNLDEHLVR
ncbi:MAG TPA: 30S ribosomal protein S6, partial [Patescibacteria group bacterium]|nr:30S ribosomal protein S6 [Patescibacteria group bacterium]